MTDTLETIATAPLAPELVTIQGKITATSLQVAQHFGKQHKDVLRAIKNLECGDEYRERNFAPTIREIPGPKNSTRTEPVYQITRDGFALLAMGFTGKEAMRWKISYLETFNRMEAALREHYVEALLDDKNFRQGIPLGLKFKLQAQGQRLMKLLRAEPDRSCRLNLYWQLFQVNLSLGIPTESMDVLVGQAVPALS